MGNIVRIEPHTLLLHRLFLQYRGIHELPNQYPKNFSISNNFSLPANLSHILLTASNDWGQFCIHLLKCYLYRILLSHNFLASHHLSIQLMAV